MPKLDSDKPPRSVVVNFLQYTVKEMVLKEAQKKKIQYQGRAVFFDHYFATDIIKKKKRIHRHKKSPKRERNSPPDTAI